MSEILKFGEYYGPHKNSERRKAEFAQARPGNYFCMLYREDEPQMIYSTALGSWQGPFTAANPAVAAAMWGRSEWDWRDKESIRVAVKASEGDVFVVRLEAKITLKPLDIYHGGPRPE